MPTMIAIAVVIAYVLSKVGCGYVWGTKGQICTLALIEKLRLSTKDNENSSFYDGNNGYTYAAKCKKWLGKQVFDCGGLFDFLLGIDLSASRYYSDATVKGNISSFPKRLGLYVFKANSKGRIYHIGIYIGNGKVIEAMGVDRGVVVTDLAGAGWDLWAECHLFDYSVTQQQEDTTVVANLGDENELVRAVQKALIALGFELGDYKDEAGNPTGADADFGDITAVALAKFKEKVGLGTNGNIVDEATFTALLKAVAAIPKSNGITQEQVNALNTRLVFAETNLMEANKTLTEVIPKRDQYLGELETLSRIIISHQ